MSIQNFGIIKTCNNYLSKCKYRCCSFSDNYIVLYPGEFEKSKLNKNHIQIIDDDYHGGKKAICLRPCKEEDFKPLDCRSYPYFPRINEKDNIGILKGIKCPLEEEDLIEHKKKFLEIWNDMIKDRKIFEWLKKVELVGYKIMD